MKTSDREWFRDCQVKELEVFSVWMSESGRMKKIGRIGPISRIRQIFKETSSDPQSPSLDQTGLPSGDQSAVEPPGPIPNPEVKRCSADGSAAIGRVRVGRCQFIPPFSFLEGGGFFLLRCAITLSILHLEGLSHGVRNGELLIGRSKPIVFLDRLTKIGAE